MELWKKGIKLNVCWAFVYGIWPRPVPFTHTHTHTTVFNCDVDPQGKREMRIINKREIEYYEINHKQKSRAEQKSFEEDYVW